MKSPKSRLPMVVTGVDGMTFVYDEGRVLVTNEVGKKYSPSSVDVAAWNVLSEAIRNGSPTERLTMDEAKYRQFLN